MGLLNYTTTISADKTVGEIQTLLSRAGARSILTEYDDGGQPEAVAFQLRTPRGLIGYRLPARMDATQKVLARQHQQGQVQRRFVSREQAARVGWRILKDWLQAQLALIETEMVSADELLLPFQLVSPHQTVYDAIVGGQLALPAACAAGGG